MVQLRKVVSPQREAYNAVSRRDYPFITGFFGMNITAIPYDRPWLLWAVLAMTAVLPTSMLLFFARRGWLTDDQRITSWARLRTWLRRRA